jgi:hypothetical protein
VTRARPPRRQDGRAAKNAFHSGVVLRIGEQLAAANPGFLRQEFLREACEGLDALGLTERGWHVAPAMARHLPHDFARAADVLIRLLGPDRAQETHRVIFTARPGRQVLCSSL